MTLLEFITYCRLSSLITDEMTISPKATIDHKPMYKIIIERDDVRCELLYNIMQGEGAIIRCYLDSGRRYFDKPTVSDIVEAFFPSN